MGFIGVGWAHSGAPWGSLRSFRRAMVVVGFILFSWIHSGAPLTIRVVGFIRVTLGRALGHVVFIRARPGGRWVHSAGSLGLVGFILERLGGRCVHSGAPWSSSGSFLLVAGRTLDPWGCRVHSG